MINFDMKLVLLVDIEQSVICVYFSHEFDIFRFIVLLSYMYEIKILWHDI